MDKPKQTGGLVLKTEEIKIVLNEPDAVGVAFQVHQPGVATNVDLRVLKVIQFGGNLMGQEKKIIYKKGAAAIDELASDVNMYEFEFLSKLISCEFSFAYMEKSDFLNLFRDNEEEVFLAGVLRNYGSINGIGGEWFTLSITTRIPPEKELFLLGNPPKTVLLEGCPTVWTYAPVVYETPEKYQLSFKKA